MAVRSRGQRVSMRKSGHNQRRSSSEIGWEEKFNLRSSLSKERVAAAADFEEDERDCSGDDWAEHNDMDEEDEEEEEEEESHKEDKKEEETGNNREEGVFEWRSENSLGDCEARLSEMVALMQKAGARIQYGEAPLQIE